MIAVWIPVTVVPTSLATVAIETFITELSRVIKNWPAASVTSTIADAFASCVVSATPSTYPRRCVPRHRRTPLSMVCRVAAVEGPPGLRGDECRPVGLQLEN